MEQPLRHFVIGTSGHIDHGKTTLVKALTGTDPDRLAEEKKRGITIDLGFAHYEANGTPFSFVDVPGHERFVHNMLAGAAGIDAVLLVIAADDGVMPQTQEHLDICNLLKIPAGLVVLTRCDLVEDPEMIELCKEEIQDVVAGTFLEGAPIVPVSSVTGEGLEKLRQELSLLYKKLRLPEYEKPFRFMIDRSFTMKGFGTIVTGTLLVGKISKEAPIHQFPQKTPVRVRGFQVHGRPVEQVEAGQRVAINLANLRKEEIQRGDQLALPNSLLTGYVIHVELHLLPHALRPLRRQDRVRVYLGTREVMGRTNLLEKDSLEPGETQLAQLRLEQPVSSRFNDRFIIRQFSPILTLGGGRVIDPAPGTSRRIQAELRNRLEALRGENKHQMVEQVIFLQSIRGVLMAELTVRTDLSEKQAGKILQDLASKRQIFCVEPADKRYLHSEHVQRIGGFVLQVMAAFHEKFPEREGMTKAELSGKLALLFRTEKEVERFLKYLVKTEILKDNDSYYHLPGHQKEFSAEKQIHLEKCLSLIQASQHQPPRRSHLFEHCNLDEKEGMAILKLAVHNNFLIRITEDLYYTPAQLTHIEQQIRHYFENHDQLTVIDFKELLQITRKHAVDVLEYFDTKHLTHRVENHRILRGQ